MTRKKRAPVDQAAEYTALVDELTQCDPNKSPPPFKGWIELQDIKP